jgi:hypothetical protein
MDDASLSKTRWRRLLAGMAVCAFAVAAGCSTYIGTTPKSFLHEAKDNVDPNIRYIAYAKLGSPTIYENPAQKEQAIELLVTKLQEGREPVAVRAVMIRSLGNLGDRRGRQEVIKGVNDLENAVVRVEACRALGKVGRPEDATLLAKIMTVDKLEDCRIAAIEGLGMLKANDPRIYQVLLDGMDHDDPAIRLESLRALREITGKDFGIDPAAWRRGLEPVIREMEAASTNPAAGMQVATPAQRGISR